ncbi:hypothetical protein [Clostridium septicum]|uniref:Uncharacterized protein n=1 Tax=Clostridium septicum TaxID=1504 RepID=A0A9N7JNL5_CLOSE|nr:hypothetical protein [Clostridium septicum]AYE35151.1 hypothetical protein CP523_12380 [Clostridium septicum]QAS60554.1 hypothetical protein EI377_07265 [Clostridium septicum]UEC20197.1 hypothetical protein LK444_12425 [Clostridium septicum]USS01748.1 hypothetical protein NH397_04760 [Clostridium septicum]WLF70321.1 hypothetical protein Q6375_04825 [Clostridium septicum]
MKFISKIISNIITVAYGVVCMPLLVLIAIFLPVFTIVEAFKIISTGYTVSTEYISMILAMSIIMYFSLRFRALRRIYKVFPSLFEALKYLVIAGIFIGVGAELLNWSYITLTPGRKIFGIASFIASLILWRVFASIYYRKKPLSKIMLESTEKMQNYNEELN